MERWHLFIFYTIFLKNCLKTCNDFLTLSDLFQKIRPVLSRIDASYKLMGKVPFDFNQ
jgi:hypothetical protein